LFKLFFILLFSETLIQPNLKAGYPNFYYQCFVKKYCRIKDDFNVNLKNKGGA